MSSVCFIRSSDNEFIPFPLSDSPARNSVAVTASRFRLFDGYSFWKNLFLKNAQLRPTVSRQFTLVDRMQTPCQWFGSLNCFLGLLKFGQNRSYRETYQSVIIFHFASFAFSSLVYKVFTAYSAQSSSPKASSSVTEESHYGRYPLFQNIVCSLVGVFRCAALLWGSIVKCQREIPLQRSKAHRLIAGMVLDETSDYTLQITSLNLRCAGLLCPAQSLYRLLDHVLQGGAEGSSLLKNQQISL